MKLKLAIGALSFIIVSQAFCEEIKLLSDLWCPYACEPKSDKPGFMVEIASEVFKAHGHTVKYEVKNWARAIQEARKGKYDGVVGASKADVPGFILHDVPAGKMQNFYWTLAGTTWTYQGESSLKNVKLGYINEYSYGDEVDKLIDKKHPSLVEISGNDVLKRMIKMTESKRLTGFIENPMVLEYNLHELKMPQTLFRAASSNLATDPDLFIAFSPKKPQSAKYAKILNEGILNLRKSGRLNAILSKYGLKDWAK